MTAALVRATGDEAWRVREMAARVIARHRFDALDAVVGLRDDPVPRVRVAANRAVAVLTAAGPRHRSGQTSRDLDQDLNR